MRSLKLHNFSLFVLCSTCLLFSSSTFAKPVSSTTSVNAQDWHLATQTTPRAWLNGEHSTPMLLIKNDVSVQHLSNYNIVHQPDADPCISISWKTNPDGSGPGYPRIYFVDGQLKLISSSAGGVNVADTRN